MCISKLSSTLLLFARANQYHMWKSHEYHSVQYQLDQYIYPLVREVQSGNRQLISVFNLTPSVSTWFFWLPIWSSSSNARISIGQFLVAKISKQSYWKHSSWNFSYLTVTDMKNSEMYEDFEVFKLAIYNLSIDIPMVEMMYIRQY